MVGTSKRKRFHCSRCRSVYGDDTLRFCTDCGGKIVADGETSGGETGKGGMFANLISRPAADESRRYAADESTQVTPDSRDGDSTRNAPVPVSETRAHTEEAIAPGPSADSDSATEPASVTAVSEADTEVEAPDVEVDPFIGKTIADRYLVRELLADGSGRRVYLGDDLQDGGRVLAKIFPGDRFDAISDRTFHIESLRKLTRFKDADFAAVLAVGRLPGGDLLLVSEYVEGNSIAQVAGLVGGLGPMRTALLVRRIGDAIEEAHGQGVFHGGLRAESIVLLKPDDPSDDFKIIGLGVAFADPEALGGARASVHDDLFDLAVIAYQALSGRNPFPGTPGGANAGTQAAAPLKPFLPELPDEVDAVLARAFESGGARSFAGIRDFGEAFYDAVTGGHSDGARVSEASPASVVAPEAPVAAADDLGRIQVRELSIPFEADNDEALRKIEVVEGHSRRRSPVLVGVAALALVALVAMVYFSVFRSDGKGPVVSMPEGGQTSGVAADAPIESRGLEVPRGFAEFRNRRESLSAEMSKSFIPFKLFHPASWKVTRSATNFADISKKDGEGVLVEHILVTSYPSNGTFSADLAKFPGLVEKSNTELSGLLKSGFRAISQGETTLQN
jgi:serine/threonine-protein kinase